MDETVLRDNKPREFQHSQGLDLLDVVQNGKVGDPLKGAVAQVNGDFRKNPFAEPPNKADVPPPPAKQDGVLKGNPFGDAQPPKSPWNPKPGDVVPALTQELTTDYRSLTSAELERVNPVKLIIKDFPGSDMIRPSKDSASGRYFFYFQRDNNRQMYFPSNLTEIEIWQNGKQYNISVQKLKDDYNQWVAAGEPDPWTGKKKEEVAKEPPRTGTPGGEVAPIWGVTVPEESTPGNWSLIGDRLAGGASASALTYYRVTRDIAFQVAPEASLALAAERTALLPLATARQNQLAGNLRGSLVGNDMLLRMRMESWPVNHLNPTQAAQYEQWTALNRMIPEVRQGSNYWNGSRFVAGEHAVAVTGDAALSTAYGRYSSARVRYENTMAENIGAARAAHTNVLRGNIGALLASEAGKQVFDSTFFGDKPASLRTTIFDVASPLVLLSSLPWYGKAGVMLGTHIVNRIGDSWSKSK